MAYSHLPMRNPRAVARDIPGISDSLFPRLTAGIVAGLNSKLRPCEGVESVPIEMLYSSTIERAMLFEIAVARGEQILNGRDNPDWDDCLKIATTRQRRYFDANIPESMADSDTAVAERVANNLAVILRDLWNKRSGTELIHSPAVAGYQWISSSEGDFSIGPELIEVKCTHRKFGVADYRQVLMYWLLSYASSIEHDSLEWTDCIFVNPRLNLVLELPFGEIIRLVAGGRSKVEVLELFSSIVGDYVLKEISEFVW